MMKTELDRRQWAALFAMVTTACLSTVVSPRETLAAPPYDLGSCTNASPAEQNTASWVMACVDPGISKKLHPKAFYVPQVRYGSPLPANFLKILRSDCDRIATTQRAIVDGKIVAGGKGQVIKDESDRCYAGLTLQAMAKWQCGQRPVNNDSAWGPRPVAYEEFEQCERSKTLELTLRDEPVVRAECGSKPAGPDRDRCVEETWALGPNQKSKEYFKQLLAPQMQIYEDQEKLAKGKAALGITPRETAVPREDRRDTRCDQPGQFMQPDRDGFGSWSCQPISVATSPDNDPPDEEPSQSGNGSGQSAIPTVRAAPVQTFTPSVQTAAPRVNRPTVTTTTPRTSAPHFRPTRHTTTSTITGREFGDSIRSYDSRQMAVVTRDHRKISVKPLVTSLNRVKPGASENLFVRNQTGTVRFSPEVQRTFSNNGGSLRNVGGVALDVTFGNLAAAGFSDFRSTGPKTLIEKPILISMRELLKAAKPYATSADRWDSLPDSIRYPGNIERVRGYVLNPATQDIFIVGTAAATRETRLDIDVITVLLNVAWKHGLTPGVSIDPVPVSQTASIAPAQTQPTGAAPIAPSPEANRRPNYNGPMQSRAINLPMDAVVTRILLDADYEMKKVNFGLVKIDDPNFKDQVKLITTASMVTAGASRFWFHPIPIGADSIRVSDDGNVVLYDAGVQLLTESLDLAGMGTGKADDISVKGAEEFNLAFTKIAASPDIKPAGIFTLLQSANDIVTLANVFRKAEVTYPVLEEFTQLPFRHLKGENAAPPFFPSITSASVEIGPNKGVFLVGGVTLRSRATRRSFDQFKDETSVLLQKAVIEPLSSGFSIPVNATFLLASPQAQGNEAAQLSKLAGTKQFATGNYAGAEQNFAEATTVDPLDIEAWIYLARSRTLAKKYKAAQTAIAEALKIDPDDFYARKLSIELSIADGEPVKIDDFDSPMRASVSNDFGEVALAEMFAATRGGSYEFAKRAAERALEWSPENPLAHFVRGFAFDQQGNFDVAISEYSESIKSLPLPHTYSLRALSYISKGQNDLALSDLNRALEIVPQNYIALTFRGDIQSERGNFALATADYNNAISLNARYQPAYLDRAMNYHRAKQIDLAMANYNQAIELKNDDQSAFKLRGDIFMDRGDFSRAISDLDRAIEIDPKYADALLSRGIVYTKLRNPGRAIADLSEAIQLNPKLGEAYRYRGVNLVEQGELDRAIAEYNIALKITPASIYAKKGRGIAYLDKREFGKAIEDFNSTLEQDGTDGQIYLFRGQSYEGAGDSQKALLDYNKSIALNSQNALALSERAALFAKIGNVSAAISDMNAVIKIKPEFEKAYINRGLLYAASGDVERSIADFSESIRRDPGFTLAYGNRALAFAKKGDFARGISDFNEVITRDPNAKFSHFNRGMLYGKSGDFDRAMSDFLQETAINPNYSPAHYNLALGYQIKKDWNAAIVEFTRAIEINPSYGEAYRGRAFAYENKGDRGRAYPDYMAAERLLKK